MKNSHVDAEALAAWADGRLPTGESNAVEAHLATCASCQEMLAVFARTEPPPVESVFSRIAATVESGFSRMAGSVESGFSRIHWRWAVPVAAAATVAAIWVAAPHRRGQDRFERTIAPALEQPAAPPASTPSPANAPSATNAPAPEAPAAAAKPGDSLRRDTTTLDDRAEKESAPAAAKAERFEPGAAQEVREGDQNSVAEAVPLAAPQAPPSGVPAPAPAAPQQAATARQAAAAPLAAADAAAREVVSPDPMVRWRILPANRLERSADGGRSWEPVALPPGLTVTAVRAPSAGVVLVTGADGRELRSDDQGKSWKQQ